MLNKTGVPTLEQIQSRFFDRAVLVKPKAILECYEDIPCNPCATSCPFQAIEIGPTINHQPKLHPERCTGCGLCVSSCPGLAILIAQIRNQDALFKIPYEFLPLPQKGQIWQGINRSGVTLCDAFIEHVQLTNQQDHTAVITVSVPLEFLYEFVTVRPKK